MTPAILAEGLVKSFGDTHAVRGVDLSVPAGTVLGLLGPNGAGKTTVVRMLATLVPLDAGRAWVAGHPVVERPDLVRESIGLTGQYTTVDNGLSGRENLYLVARLLNFSRRSAWARVDALVERLDLGQVAGRLVSTYSGGTRRRLDLAASLVNRPQVLYLDEPTTGLDPHSRNELWTIIRELVAGGTTVLLTTQYMAEAEELADHVVVMAGGRVIASGSPTELRARVAGTMLRIRPGPNVSLDDVADVLTRAGLGPAAAEREDGLVTLPIPGDSQLTSAVGALGAANLALSRIETYTPTLDEVFLTLTGERDEHHRRHRSPAGHLDEGPTPGAGAVARDLPAQPDVDEERTA